MYPKLFDFSIGGIHCSLFSYSFFLGLGIFVATLLGVLFIYRYGLSFKRSMGLVLAIVIASVTGARAFFVATEKMTFTDFLGFQLNHFSIIGGLIAAIITAIALSPLLKFRIFGMGDAVVPGLAIGIILARIGCFLNGCCFGIECTKPWGVIFPKFSSAHVYQFTSGQLSFLTTTAHAVHPTQIYEMLAVALGLLLFLYLKKKQFPEGIPFLVFIGLYCVFRVINSFFRVPSPYQKFSDIFYNLLYSFLSFGCVITSVVLKIQAKYKTQ